MYNVNELENLFHHFFHWNRARIRCIVPLIIGMIQLGTVNLSKIAATFPGTAQSASHYKRLQRLFRHFPLDLNQIARFIAHLIPLLQFKLTLDRTNWKLGSYNLNFLVLAIVYRGIAFPLLWILLDKKGNSNTSERIEIMERFLTLFGPQSITCLFADREFVGVKWFGYLIDHHIDFRIRIKCNSQVSNSRGTLVSVENLFRGLPRGGYQVLSGKRQLWGHSLYIIGLKMADGELVIIATQDQPETALADYKERWQIETLFGWQATNNTHHTRLEKLLAFLAIAFCWSHLVGEWLHEVKPITLKNHGRPAQSLFRYGFDYLRACLFHHHESARQYAFHQALEQLFKRLGWSPQKSRSSPTVDSIPLTI
jgi:hypothetical protein